MSEENWLTDTVGGCKDLKRPEYICIQLLIVWFLWGNKVGGKSREKVGVYKYRQV